MAIRPPPQSEVQRSLTIPPPVMGWSTKQPISQMDPRYAPDIENFFPQNGSVDLRNGSEIFANIAGTGNAVVSLVNYRSTTVNQLLAVTTTLNSAFTVVLYDISSGGTGTEITTASPPGNPLLYAQQFKGRLFLTTGAGDLGFWYYDGGASYSKDASLVALGPMTTYKGRIYFATAGFPSGAASYYYSDFDSTTSPISGSRLENISSLLKLGGEILFLGNVTRAKEFLEDELFCIITDQGEVLVYQGDSPESTTWAQIGHYYLPTPMGPRAFFYIGHDLHIITLQGIIPMSGVMSGTKTGAGYLTISDEIDNFFRENYATDLANNPSWNGLNYPKGGYALVNIPQAGVSANDLFYGIDNIQLIVNTNTGAWTRFTNQDAYCWCVFETNLYFGTSNGEVFKADTGDSDKDSAGTVVARNILLRHAFNYLGNPSIRKKPICAIPTVYQSEGLSLTINCDVDYTNNVATSTETDTSQGTSYQIYQPRCGLVADSGSAISIRIDGTVTTKQMSLQATEVQWNEGTDF